MDQLPADQLKDLEEQQAQNDILKTVFGDARADEKFIPTEKQHPLISQWELSFYDVIEEIEHILSGETRDANGEWQPQKDAQGTQYRLMNDRGIHDVKIILNAIANKNTFLSSLSEERVYYFIRTFRINLVSLLAMNHEQYGMDRKYRDYIVEMLTTIVASAFFRAQDGGEAKRRASTTIIRHSYGEINKPFANGEKKGGLLGLGILGL